MTTRRDFLKLAGAGVGAAAGALWSTVHAETARAHRPNILWLVAEDMGHALGCYGQKGVSTPNLDAMARAGVRYSRFYTTAPVCSPSRSAFMTGMFATTIGAHQHRTRPKQPLPDGVRLVTDRLRDAGYFTANLVQLPEACGFRGTGKTDWNFTHDGRPFDSANWADLKTHQPFLAQINFQETHRAFHAPPHADPAKVELPPYYPDHPVVRKDHAAYLDAATELDRKVGKVLAQLERDGLAGTTMVVFMGDNGEAHIRGKQFCYEEGLRVPLLIRWPKALPAPEHFLAGGVDGRLLMSIDLTATLLALAGANVPPKMEGRPFLGREAGPSRQYVFGARDRCDETAMRIRTVRDDRYRYIRNFTPEVPFLAPNQYKERQYPLWTLLPQLNAAGKLTPEQAALCAPRMAEEELYDLQADPHEVRNLAKSPEHAQVLERLQAVLNQWIEQTGDRGRQPEPPQEAAGAARKPAKASRRRKDPKETGTAHDAPPG
jgi:arylsulfatase A-like enzyme